MVRFSGLDAAVQLRKAQDRHLELLRQALESGAHLGHLALTYGVDILPLYLHGTREAMPKGGKPLGDDPVTGQTVINWIKEYQIQNTRRGNGPRHIAVEDFRDFVRKQGWEVDGVLG